MKTIVLLTLGFGMLVVSLLILTTPADHPRTSLPQIHEVANQLDPQLDGQLVHLTATPRLSGEARDPDFDFSVPALVLSRIVYKYDSYGKNRTPHWVSVNQAGIATAKFYPAQVRAGPYLIDPDQSSLSANTNSQPYQPSKCKTPAGATWHHQMLYLDGNPEAPRPNDRRVAFYLYPNRTISIIGRQRQDRLEPPSDYLSGLWTAPGAVPAEPFRRQMARRHEPARTDARPALLGIAGIALAFASRRKPESEDPIPKG